MALGGPEGPATGRETTDPIPEDTSFDLGDSRDLAAAVRAAWGSAPPASPAEPTQSGPILRPVAGAGPGRDPATNDPLAHLRGEVQRRRFGPRVTFSPARRSTLLASVGVAAAIAAVAALPLVSGGSPRPTSPIVDERSDPTTTTSTIRRAVATTAFTYPPETRVPAESVPAAVPTPAPAAPRPEARPSTTGARTVTTSRPRTTTTTRRASTPTTRAPSPTTTTTQPPPPPPPDDGGGSGDPGDPPPYP